jgi:fimbrial chaperone protein
MASKIVVSSIAALCGFGLVSTAVAGSLELGPVSIEMVGKQRAATMTVRNVDATPAKVQMRTVDWSLSNGADTFDSSKNLVVSPPVTVIKPGETQTVRLVVENVDQAATEKSFRLLVDQLPGEPNAQHAGVQTVIRASVPVFLAPSTSSRPNLRWTAVRTADGLAVTAHNDGDMHERIDGLKIAAGGQALGAGPLNGYVLSKSERTWVFKDAPASVTEVAATGDGLFAPVNAHVAVSR